MKVEKRWGNCVELVIQQISYFVFRSKVFCNIPLYIYIYIYIERERERRGQRKKETRQIWMSARYFTSTEIFTDCKENKKTLFQSLNTSVLCMTWNCIWWWGSSSEIMGSAEYSFFAIIHKSILIQIDNTSKGPIYGSNKSV